MMIKIYLTIMAIGFSSLLSSVHAQSTEVEQLLLNVEKLTQFKQILSDMKKGYEVISLGYNSVKDISQGNFSLHKAFLDGLMEVSPTVKKYRKVAEIISMEIRLVSDYKTALKRFQLDENFNPGEIDYIEGVYHNLVKKSLENLDGLTTIVTAGRLRMTDDERLKAIDAIHRDMQTKVSFLKYFNTSTSVLTIQRKVAKNDLRSLGNIHGVKN